MFDPRDLTAHSFFEEMEWVGLEGQCDRCRIIYFIPRPALSGRCPKCEWGWVTTAPRVQARLEVANYMEWKEKIREESEKERAKNATATPG